MNKSISKIPPYLNSMVQRYFHFISVSIFTGIYNSANTLLCSKHLSQKMEAAEKYICAHFKDDELSVKKLAADARMSEVHFRNLFYSCYHVTPAKYIMNVRLENAKALMQYNFFTLEEIALQSGFSSVPYFCKVFKAATNMTPSAYRKRVIP